MYWRQKVAHLTEARDQLSELDSPPLAHHSCLLTAQEAMKCLKYT